MVNNIRAMREKNNLSIQQLSVKTGISIEQLCEFESPEFNIEEMSSYSAAYIAEALGCLISDLIYDN